VKLRYTVILDPDPDDGGYTVTVPALPGCITEGDSYDEAIANAREAIAGYVEDAVQHGEPVPTDDAGIVVLSIDVAEGHLAPA
jgi:predicted RNase H-like HicB family nuclease